MSSFEKKFYSKTVEIANFVNTALKEIYLSSHFIQHRELSLSSLNSRPNSARIFYLTPIVSGNWLSKHLFILFFFFAVAFSFVSGQERKTISQKREQEKQINANLVLGAINISVVSNHSENAFEYKFTSSDTSMIDCSYLLQPNSHEEESVGQLKITQHSKSKEETFTLGGFFRSGSSSDEMQSLRLSLSDELPVTLDVTIAGASADLNLTGLQLKKLGLKSGACKTKIHFQSPNKEILESLKVAAGASSIVMSGLGFANMENFNYTGGASNAVIDFSGEFTRNLTAKISVGAGSATVYIPKNANVVVRYEENFFSSVKLPADFEAQEGYFTTANHNPNAHTIELHLSSGVGSVKVQWK